MALTGVSDSLARLQSEARTFDDAASSYRDLADRLDGGIGQYDSRTFVGGLRSAQAGPRYLEMAAGFLDNGNLAPSKEFTKLASDEMRAALSSEIWVFEPERGMGSPRLLLFDQVGAAARFLGDETMVDGSAHHDAVEAAGHISRILDSWRTRYGIERPRSDGSPLHVSVGGSKMGIYDQGFLALGGAGQHRGRATRSSSASPTVIAHELGHHLDELLSYKARSSRPPVFVKTLAMFLRQEGVADVFAAIENRRWQIGDDALITGQPIRDIADPHRGLTPLPDDVRDLNRMLERSYGSIEDPYTPSGLLSRTAWRLHRELDGDWDALAEVMEAGVRAGAFRDIEAISDIAVAFRTGAKEAWSDRPERLDAVERAIYDTGLDDREAPDLARIRVI
jgi:hypothetical protein